MLSTENFVSLVSTNSYKFNCKENSKYIISPNNVTQRHVSKNGCALCIIGS